MKKINKLAAAMAVALSMTAMPQANAEIEYHPNGRGDALLFPIFNGYIENYFTIMNHNNSWIQGHLRFRGAAWSGELRDFDVILSPGDVFVFRVADIDGDGWWEIDQSLDLRNFQYTGLGGTPERGGMDDYGVNTCTPQNNPEGKKIPKCMDPSEHLVPTAIQLAGQLHPTVAKNDLKNRTDLLAEAQSLIDYQKNMGYVEFIGEAVLDGMDHEIMEILLGTEPGGWKPYQTQRFSKRGTTAWAWSDAANQFARDHRLLHEGNNVIRGGLSDVPNALTGTGFISIPGVGHGLAYNAEALVNFRTSATEHRIDNYRMVCNGPGQQFTTCFSRPSPINNPIANRAVIVHDENASGSAMAVPHLPFGDYVYQFGIELEDRDDEQRISFNNTWGPTLADGDDYNMALLRTTLCRYEEDTVGCAEVDDFDSLDVGQLHGLATGDLRPANSIAEVEEAIRLGVSKNPPANPAPAVFTAYYMDGDIFDKSCEGNGTRQNTDFCPQPIPPGQSRAKPPAGATTLTTLTSYYLAYFPTKFYYGERKVWADTWAAVGAFTPYWLAAIEKLLVLRKPTGMEVWDNFERSGECGPASQENVSPAPPPSEHFCDLGFELSFLSINDIKNLIGPITIQGELQDFIAGRVVLDIPWDYNYPKWDDAGLSPEQQILIERHYDWSWPGLMYTFEWDGATNLAHFRPMQRMPH